MGVVDTYKNVSGFNMLNSFLHPGDPYEAAERPIQDYWNQAKGYLDPYNQYSKDQYGTLQGAESALLNPEELQNRWASGYENSPYAKRLLEMNKGAGLDAASSMNLMGSSAALQNIQQGAGDIVASQREAYLKDLMEKYMKGIGIGTDIFGEGAKAANTLGQGALQTGQNLAGLEYGKEAAPGNLFSKFLGLGAGAGMNYLMPGSGNLQGASNMFNQ